MNFRLQELNQDDLYYYNDELKVAISYKNVMKKINSNMRIQIHSLRVTSRDNSLTEPVIYYLREIPHADNWILISKEFLTQINGKLIYSKFWPDVAELRNLLINTIRSKEEHDWIWSSIGIIDIPDNIEVVAALSPRCFEYAQGGKDER